MPVLEAALSFEQQHALIIRWQHLPRHVARRLCRRRRDVAALGIEDAAAAGAVGLVKAAAAYDPSRCLFQTFAYTCISNAVLVEAGRWRRRSADQSLDAAPGLAEEVPARPEANPDDAGEVERLLLAVPRHQADILRSLHGVGCEPVPAADLAARHGVSKARIYQVARGAAERIRRLRPMPAAS